MKTAHSERLKNEIKAPGLSSGYPEINRLGIALPKKFSVLQYKQEIPCLWVVFVGGTGTGKSTSFNALCGKAISETGVERPKTSGPIAYAHKRVPVEHNFPFDTIRIDRVSRGHGPSNGAPGRLTLLEHERTDWAHLIVVDTPDLDSVELENRHIAEELFLLSDAVVFVTSQEKYADEVPSLFFQRVLEESKPYYFLLNKAREQLVAEEIAEPHVGHRFSLDENRLWVLAYELSPVEQRISEQSAFKRFAGTFFQELSASKMDQVRSSQLSTDAKTLKKQLDRLLDLLQAENLECDAWLRRLNAFHQNACHDLVKEEKARFMSKSQEYLKLEIRSLFSKYDLLAGPRRFLREIFSMPLRFLGFRKNRFEKNHRDVLTKVMRKIDWIPIQRAVEKFNRLVLESIPPQNEHSPFFKKLRQPGVLLSDDEISKTVLNSQDRLAVWMEQTVAKLSQGIPQHKKWGIYSTSLLWGIMMISVEIAVGGGFTVLDAALDSVLAPFLTKGAVELFAYHEIQKIAREMAERYQDGLLSVLHLQRDRYESCLRSLMTTDATLDTLKEVYAQIDHSAHLQTGWNDV